MQTVYWMIKMSRKFLSDRSEAIALITLNKRQIPAYTICRTEGRAPPRGETAL
jgi:hypothetical protein